MPTKRPGPPKKSRLQRRLTAHELRTLRNSKPDPLQYEPRWFRDLYVKVMEFFGLRKAS